LLVNGVVATHRLADGRLAEAAALVDQLPPTWPAARAGGAVVRAWVAVAQDAPNAIHEVHTAITETTNAGLWPAVTEALELLASQLIDGDPDTAARLLGASAAARDEMGLRWRPPHHTRLLEQTRASAAAALGAQFDDRFDEGHAMALADAVRLTQRHRRQQRRANHGWAALTPAELAVASEVAAGRTNAQAAARLFVAPSTVKSHLERIYTKLGITSRAALATEVSRRTK
jgi:DNA-binding CsgD family transcriptional regulator